MTAIAGEAEERAMHEAAPDAHPLDDSTWTRTDAEPGNEPDTLASRARIALENYVAVSRAFGEPDPWGTPNPDGLRVALIAAGGFASTTLCADGKAIDHAWLMVDGQHVAALSSRSQTDHERALLAAGTIIVRPERAA